MRQGHLRIRHNRRTLAYPTRHWPFSRSNGLHGRLPEIKNNKPSGGLWLMRSGVWERTWPWSLQYGSIKFKWEMSFSVTKIWFPRLGKEYEKWMQKQRWIGKKRMALPLAWHEWLGLWFRSNGKKKSRGWSRNGSVQSQEPQQCFSIISWCYQKSWKVSLLVRSRLPSRLPLHGICRVLWPKQRHGKCFWSNHLLHAGSHTGLQWGVWHQPWGSSPRRCGKEEGSRWSYWVGLRMRKGRCSLTSRWALSTLKFP